MRGWGWGRCEEALLISCHSHPHPHPCTPAVCCAFAGAEAAAAQDDAHRLRHVFPLNSLEVGWGAGGRGGCAFLLTSHAACPPTPDCQRALERHADQNLGAVSSRMLSLRLFCFELHFTLLAASCSGPTAETRRCNAAT